MYYLLHRNQLHVSALYMAIFRLIMRNLISSYIRFACVVYSGEEKGEIGTRSRIRDLVLFGGIYMYYLLHRNQLHVLVLFMAIFRLIMRNLISSYIRFTCVVYSGEVKDEVGTRSRMRVNVTRRFDKDYVCHIHGE